jgi:hypothetical protein
LAAAFTSSATALLEFQDKAVDIIGKRKVEDIKDAVMKDKIDENPVSKNEVIVTENGDTLCYDAHSGRYFKSDINKIKKAVNEVNHILNCEDCVSLNDFYDQLGLSHTKMGDELGWPIGSGLIDVRFSSHLAEDNTPCLAMEYRVVPTYDFQKFW